MFNFDHSVDVTSKPIGRKIQVEMKWPNTNRLASNYNMDLKILDNTISGKGLYTSMVNQLYERLTMTAVGKAVSIDNIYVTRNSSKV